MREDYYRDKNILVTGAASGIGLELATRLSERGARVWGADINFPEIASTTQNLNSGFSFRPVRLDVTDRKAFAKLVESTTGPLDILFNNAGIALTAEAREYTPDDWKRVVDINVFGVINGIDAVYKQMTDRGRGQIVNTASIAGLYPSAGQTAYSASKYAVVGLSHSLRAEAAGHGVKVTVVCPGIIRTSMRENLPIKGIDPASLLEILPEGMEVTECVRQILDGVERNESTIVISPLAKILWAANRINPDLAIWLGERVMDLIRWRNRGKQQPSKFADPGGFSTK